MPKTVIIEYNFGEDSVSYNFTITNYFFHEDEVTNEYTHDGLLSLDSEVFELVFKDLTGKDVILDKLEKPGMVKLTLAPDGMEFTGENVDLSCLEGVKEYVVGMSQVVHNFISLNGFSDSITFNI